MAPSEERLKDPEFAKNSYARLNFFCHHFYYMGLHSPGKSHL
jgi:hypothetical protein